MGEHVTESGERRPEPKKYIKPNQRNRMSSQRKLADLTEDEGAQAVGDVIRLLKEGIKPSVMAKKLGFSTRSVMILIDFLRKSGEIESTRPLTNREKTILDEFRALDPDGDSNGLLRRLNK